MSPVPKDHNHYRPFCGIYDVVPFKTCPRIRTPRSLIFSVRVDCDGRTTFINQHLSEFTQERAAVTLAKHVWLAHKCVDHLNIRAKML
jgi:hypothetical protein